MNSFNCSDIRSLSPHYLRLKRSPRESRGAGGSHPILSSLTPLTLHITSFSSARKTEKTATDKRQRGEKENTQNPIQSKREREGERKRWGGGGVHALINERLISTKLITGSWMVRKRGMKRRVRKRRRKEECNMTATGTPMGILSLSFPHNPS